MEPSASVEANDDADTDGAGAAATGPDPRLELMGSFVIKSLKLKPEKWTRLITVEEYKGIIKEFLDRPVPVCLVIILTQSAQLVPTTTFPLTQLKSKGVFFVKRYIEPLPRENCSKFIIYGDLATRTIDQLSTLVEEVLVPLLAFEDNYKTWPTMVVQDVQKHVHSLKSIVHQVKGQVSGETILAMPVGVEKILKASKRIGVEPNFQIDLYLKSAIEGVVIKWAQQIHAVVKENSANAFWNETNPTPQTEFTFWNNRLKNLSYIYDQLRDDRIRAMALILEHSRSAYYPCFQTQFKNVVAALAEAKDITLYLNPLQKFIQHLEEAEFSECKPQLIQVMHVVCMVWGNSRYYTQSSKITVLLREICNLIINRAKRFLDPSSIFHSDIDEAMQRLNLAIDILKFFRELFDHYKERISEFFKEPDVRPPILWTFHPNAVFRRLSDFLERLNTIKWFFYTVLEFLKLEKVEIGGLRGRQLSNRVTAVYAEFNQCFAAFASKSYNILDPDDDRFMTDFKKFQTHIVELDMKLAAIFCQAFNDCHSLESIFKLINIVGSILERPIIKEHFNKKYDEIVNMLDKELSICEEIYEEQMFMRSENKCLYPEYNCPPVAAFIRWCGQLERRITIPMQQFQALQHDIIKSEKALDIIKRYERLLLKIGASRTSIFVDWSENLAEQIESNLQKSLISRNDDTKMLCLNFSAELFCILREVYYLTQMEVDNIPKEALEFSAKSNTFRTYTLHLEKTIDWYNSILENSSPVELKLIDCDIKLIDNLIETGINELVWTSEDIMGYLEKLREPVTALQRRVSHTQNNLNEIRNVMSKWVKQPLFKRRDGKRDTVLCIDERSDRTAKRYAEIARASENIHKLLYDNMLQFNMETKQNDKVWLNYVDFVDNIVYEYLLKTVGVSVGYIAENMDPENNYAPLFEARLELLDPNLIFIPSLDPKDSMGFNNMLIELIRDIMKMGSLVKRLKANEKYTYSDIIKENKDIVEMRCEILNGVDLVIEEAAIFCRQFERYSYLWLDNREECMEYFLTYGRVLDAEEIEMILMNEGYGYKPCPPTIEAFREQIDHYESLYTEVEDIAAYQIFNSWFQVDVRPFRQALLNTVCKWGNMFKTHLVNTVTTSLTDLGNFIRKADEGLLQTVKEGDYDGLVNIMAYLMQVKDRTAKTDEMFEPLQETIHLLKYYDMDIPEEVNVLLQELPEQWANTKKIALTVKQQVSPLQATEVVNIRNKVAAFEIYVQEFRETFRHYEFFQFHCQNPYGLADRINSDMERLENEMAEIQESGSLFEVNIPEFKLLKQCRKELKMLKQLWDYVFIVKSCIEDWKTTPWRKVDVENMDIECKKFAKDIRLLDKEMRSWDTFVNLESTVKNMLTSLRAVGELQNPAIRERHWNQLMRSTKISPLVSKIFFYYTFHHIY